MHRASRPALGFLAMTILTVAGCDTGGPGASGNATLRDMAVVEGSANDSMVDLDAAVTSGTAIAGNNSGPAPAAPDGPPPLSMPFDNAGSNAGDNAALAPE